MEITLSVRKIGIAVKPGPTIAAGFPNHGHGNKSILDGFTVDSAGHLYFRGVMITGNNILSGAAGDSGLPFTGDSGNTAAGDGGGE